LNAAAIIEELETRLSQVNSALSALKGMKRNNGRPSQFTDGRKHKDPLSAAARKQKSATE
jgi:hypothetical protein